MTELKSIKVAEITTPIPYSDGHPTEEGTSVVMKDLETQLKVELILAPDDVVTDRRYSQVQSCYKVGCRGCEYRQYTASLCARCMENAKVTNIDRITALIKEIHGQEFPSAEEDIDMMEILKRTLPVGERNENGNDINPNKKNKVNKNNKTEKKKRKKKK